ASRAQNHYDADALFFDVIQPAKKNHTSEENDCDADEDGSRSLRHGNGIECDDSRESEHHNQHERRRGGDGPEFLNLTCLSCMSGSQPCFAELTSQKSVLY